MKKHNQNGLSAKISPTQTSLKFRRAKEISAGFGLVEALLIIIAVGIVSFGGYYVWHTQHNKNSSTAAPAAPTKTTSSSTTSTQQYLTIKEWGVKIPLTKDISDLTYEVSGKGLDLHDRNQVTIKFYTDRFKKAGGVCDSNQSPLSVIRGVGSDIPIFGDESDPGDVSTNSYAYLYSYPKSNSFVKMIIKVGDYYYTEAVNGGGSCATSNSDQDRINVINAPEQARIPAMLDAVKKMQTL